MIPGNDANLIIAVLMQRLGEDTVYIRDEEMIALNHRYTIEVMSSRTDFTTRVRIWPSTDQFPPGPARKAPIKVTATRLSPTPELEAPADDQPE